jgi:hypothetical protein
MSSVSHEVDAVIDAIPNRSVPMPVVGVGVGLMVLGLAGFGYGMMTNPAWAWGAFLVGLVFTLSMAQGGVIFSVVGTLTWAHWSRPLKRIAESFAFYLPFGYAALLFFLALGHNLYPWSPNTFVEGGPVEIHPHGPAVLFAAKPIWLSMPFFIGRQALGLLALFALDFVYLKFSLGPDMLKAKQRLGDKAPGWWSTFIGGQTDLNAAVAQGQAMQTNIAPFVAVGYALMFSLVAFDLIMSLHPWWYSNIFGGWFFSNSIWQTLAMIGVVAMFSRDWLGLGKFIKPKTTHDLGMMLLAFTMAYAYMLFAQILPIWYANMPEETDFLMVRMLLPEWGWMSRVVAVLCFLMPFTILLSRGIKKMRWPFAAICTVILVGVFFDRTLLVMPSVFKGSTFPIDLFLGTSIPVWLGFVGLFITVVSQVLARIPPLVVSDPRVEAHPWDVHVHSDDAHAAHH